MLRQDNLDDLTFQEIVDRARLSIAEYMPGWTDQNTHDPGIMLIELFAWLIEMQQFYLDQNEEAEAALPLLGLTCRRAAPAAVTVRMRPGKAVAQVFGIPSGTPLMADNIPFETAEPFIYGAADIKAVATCEGRWETSQVAALFPFGEKPQAGNSFSIFFDAPLEPGREHTLETAVYPSLPGRNPIDPNRPPRLAEIDWEYLTEDGYEPLAVEDGSHGFIADGITRFTLVKPMALDPGGYYELRCTLAAHEYDVPPRIDALQPAVFTAVQRETLCEDIVCETTGKDFSPATYLAETGEVMLFYESAGEYTRLHDFTTTRLRGGFTRYTVAESLPASATAHRFHAVSCAEGAQAVRVLGFANGFPNQRFQADTRGGRIVYESFALLVGDGYEFNRAHQWHKVENFYRSTPTDRHYTLDEISGRILFGDGIRGAMPKGVVLIASMSTTFGAEGNIAARQLHELRYDGRIISLEQPSPAEGGRERESAAQSLARAGQRLERMVTAQDIEELVKGTPGLIIDRVKAYAARTAASHPFDPYRVMVAVKPPGEYQQLSAVYRRYIREYLEPFRLAGCEIEIVSPGYARVEITAEVLIYPRDYSMAENIKIHLKKFFEKTYGSFGAGIQKSELMTELASFPTVERVISLSLRVSGGHARETAYGDIVLELDTLACWGGLDLLIH